MKRFVLVSVFVLIYLLGCREYELAPGCKESTISCQDGDNNCHLCKHNSWLFCNSKWECKTYYIEDLNYEEDIQCQSDDDCPELGKCRDELCVWGNDCDSDVECDGGICNDGVCVDVNCTDDIDCPEGFVCGEFNYCEKYRCTSNHDCEPGYICLKDGNCDIKHVCNSNDECGDGLICRKDGQCASEYFATVWSPELRVKLYNQEITMKILTTNEDCSSLKISWDWKEGENNEFETVECKEITDNTFIPSKYKLIEKPYPALAEGEEMDTESELVIKIEGELDGFMVYRDSNDLDNTGIYAPNLIEVRSFGLVGLAKEAFLGCTQLKSVSSVDNPDANKLTNTSGMFQYCGTFNSSLNAWDVSNVEDMSHMFEKASTFNQPLDEWDVSNVSDMSSMFNGASKFNQDLSRWYPESVDSAKDMFKDSNINKTNACKIYKEWTISSTIFETNAGIQGVFGKIINCVN